MPAHLTPAQVLSTVVGMTTNPQNIYIVTAGEYDDYAIQSVHATREGAQKALAVIQSSDRPADVREAAGIEVHEVQP